jgi:hypothetical protein
VTPDDREPRTGVAVIRAWVEAGDAGPGDDALRARVVTVEHGDPASERTMTAAGVGDVIALVREFLVELSANDRPASD